MGRLIKEIQLNQSLDVVSVVMEDFFYHNRFTRSYWNDEMVFCSKDGSGRERYVKWTYICGVFHLEAWMNNGRRREVSPRGLGSGKSEFRNSINRLILSLKSSKTDYAGGHMNSDPIHHEAQYDDNHRQWTEDTKWQEVPKPQVSPDYQETSVYREASAGNTYENSEDKKWNVITWIAVGLAFVSPILAIIMSVVSIVVQSIGDLAIYFSGV